MIHPAVAFRIMCFSFKLSKQGDDIQPCHTTFPVLNQSVVPHLGPLNQFSKINNDNGK